MNSLFGSAISSTVSRLIGDKNTKHLSILIYHRVVTTVDVLQRSLPTEVEFDWQMELISKYFNPLSLTEALNLMETDDLPPRPVCVTFDDGYSDNLNLALPIMKRWGIPATIFVSTKFLNGGRMWNDTITEAARLASSSSIDLSSIDMGVYPLHSEGDRIVSAQRLIEKVKYLSSENRREVIDLIIAQADELPRDLMLTSIQLRQLCNEGVEIGAHTHSHPILSSLDLAGAREEITHGKQVLEEILGKPARYFAYPNGRPSKDYYPEHKDLVREAGFSAALSTQWGVSSQRSDRWQLARFTPWDKAPERFLFRLLLNLRNVVEQ